MLFVTPSLILLAGLIDDLKSQKVHNWLVATLLVIALLEVLVTKDVNALQQSGLSLVTAVVLFLPFVFLKILGAGDMKLMMAFAVATTPTAVLWVTVYAFIWGALLGLLKVIFGGGLTQLFVNLNAIANKDKVDKKTLTKIPYTVALFFGWLTVISLHGGGL